MPERPIGYASCPSLAAANRYEVKYIVTLSPYSHTFNIPSPTHSFTLGLNPSFSANPPYRSLSFVSFKIHYMDFPRLFTATSEHIRLFTFLFFFLFLHFFSCRFRAVD